MIGLICWICDKKLQLKEYNYLPSKEDIFQIPNIKNTYEIKTVDKFTFLYYIVCNSSLHMYLDNYPFDFNKIRKREIGK